MKSSKPRTYSYPISWKFTDNKTGNKVTVLTQIYPVGVYVCIETNAGKSGRDQLNLNPSGVKNLWKKTEKLNKEGKIKDLERQRLIFVTTDERGLYKEKPL